MSDGIDFALLKLAELPKGWHYKTVSEIGAIGEQPVLTGPFGTNLGRGDFVESGIPLLTIGCLTQGGINLDKALFVSEEKAQELSRYRLKEGDLLFSRMASVGRAGLVPKWLEGALFNYHIMRLRLDESRIDTRLFINYVRGAKQVRDYLKAVNHGATRDGINTEQLLGLPVVVPPIKEQREIVAEIEKQFSRLDEAVANLQRVKANLKRYKASVLKAAVEGRLVETEATLARSEGRTYETGKQLLQRILGERRAKWAGKGKYKEPTGLPSDYTLQLPDGWTSATVDQLGNVQLGKMLDKQKHTAGVPHLYLRNINVRWGGFDLSDVFEMNFESDELERFSVRESDVLVCEGGEPARAAVWRAKHADMKYQKALHRVRFDGAFLPDLLVIALEHLAKSGALDELYGGSTIKHFTRETFIKLVLPVPPIAEQIRIVAEVDRHLSIVREVEAEVDTDLQRAQALRQATLARAFSAN